MNQSGLEPRTSNPTCTIVPLLSDTERERRIARIRMEWVRDRSDSAAIRDVLVGEVKVEERCRLQTAQTTPYAVEPQPPSFKHPHLTPHLLHLHSTSPPHITTSPHHHNPPKCLCCSNHVRPSSDVSRDCSSVHPWPRCPVGPSGPPPILALQHHQTSPSPSSKSPPPLSLFPGLLLTRRSIDGVLMHGSTPIPTATSALELLRKNSVEFILLTNGGGKSESSRTAELSSYLSVPIDTSQFIQSHTPFAAFAGRPEFETVLVMGGEGDMCRQVAKGYGFKNVIIPADILAAYPPVSPFTVDKSPAYAQPLPPGDVKIDAVLVFNDPRDWALDLQVLLDLVLSDEGQLGTRRRDISSKPHLPIYFSNPDLIWANEYHLPRLGQGGFRAAFQGVMVSLKNAQKSHRAMEGLPLLQYKVMGKPYQDTYAYAEGVLCEWRKKQLELASPGTTQGDIKTVYMVGDNPASDIRGANGFKSDRGIRWISVLVTTGVYKGGLHTGDAKQIVGDVLAAVEWAMEREKSRKEGHQAVVWKKAVEETLPEAETA